MIYTHNHVGDNICMTAVIHNIYQQTKQPVSFWCPQQYRFIFQKNPYVFLQPQLQNGILIKYPGSQALSDKGNLCQAYSTDALQKLGLKEQLHYQKPQFYFHLQKPDLPQKYVVISAGYQIATAVKNWGRFNWQAFVDKYKDRVTFVQVGAQSRNDSQPYLQGVISLVGKTDIKQLIQVIAFSSGVVCHASCAGHIAAAFNIPAIYIIGNREGQLIGKYDCTFPAGQKLTCGPCMKFHCGAGNPVKTCTSPAIMVNQLVPMCMAKTNIDSLFQEKILSRVI